MIGSFDIWLASAFEMPFQTALVSLRQDWLSRQLLLASGGKFEQIADRMARDDPFGEVTVLRECLKLAAPDLPDSGVKEWYAHSLWCSYRELLWQGSPSSLDCDVDAVSRQAIAETAGCPTILCGPMTMAQSDVLDILRRQFPDRAMVAYGEGISELEAIPAAGEGMTAVRNIHRVLAMDGVLVTYADFSYSNHQSVPARLFGTLRSFASGLLSFAMRPKTCVLPIAAYADHRSNRAKLVAEEPFAFAPASGTDLAEARAVAAQTIATTLERLIRPCPQQWLLLPTLCFESPQSA